ncbi:MAG TPA: hypothetical protein DCK95_11860 [Anaerolineaceae bacterium]|uniref:Cell cycle protein n=1 Tax=Anaerolinea thermophila TaxID=167964 RepID=A0A101FXZ6_9CHLR|nr:MAG: Cell cycle protein [Anaerolinea thermophila]HAF63002.1 hypothetical protein [Anaerolineaceae bacterium]
MIAAGSFLLFFAIILTISPAVKYHSWQVELRWTHWIGLGLITGGFFFLQHTLDRIGKNCDPTILPIIYLLSGWGMLTISRLNTYFGLRQALWILASLLLTYFLFVRKKSIVPGVQKYSLIGLIASLVLQIATIFWGNYPGGSGPTLWLNILGINIQPSEFLKVFFIIFLSAFFAKKEEHPRKFKTLFPTLLLFAIISGVLIFQDDFGTTIIFLVIYASFLLFFTGRKRAFGFTVLAFLLLGVVGYYYFDIFTARISSWLLPWDDPSGGSYQVIQSILSIAAGGVIGTGPGLGYPNVVPLAHSDFIFSAIAEETGFLGTSCFILLYAILLTRGFKLARERKDPFQSYLAAGVTTYLVAQAILIIGGNIRLLPITGVTLPFVSYGGSSYVSAFFAISLLFCMEPSTSTTVVSEKHTYSIKKALSVIGSLFMIALLLIEFVLFWWGFVRADDLQSRSDNPRLIFADQYVSRGTIYDRDDSPLAITQGTTGTLYRFYPYPLLSNTIGFSHSRYGRSGIEESLNEYLRGYQGYPKSYVWFNHLIYDQPPTGIDVQLTLDLDIQQELDSLFGDLYGSAIVVDGSNGEILAIASHPGFNANELDENWENWNQDEDALFLNRVMQGSYPAGSILIPFLLDEETWQDFSPAPESQSSIGPNNCSSSLFFPNDVIDKSMAQHGCPYALYKLLEDIPSQSIKDHLTAFGFFSHPSVALPLSETYLVENLSNPISYGLGQQQIRFSPLLVAQAVLRLNYQENTPELHLVMDEAVVSESTFQTQTNLENSQLTRNQANFLLSEFFLQEKGCWTFQGTALDENGTYQWIMQSTSADSDSKRTIVVIVLENADEEQARSISDAIYRFSQTNQD